MGAPGSALLQLPRELRDHIYRCLLAKTFLVENACAGETSAPPPARHLAILGVSKATYEEAKRVFYRYGRFRFDLFKAGSPAPPQEILLGIPAIPLLQDVVLRLDVGAAFGLGLSKPDFAAVATKLVNAFARCDSGVPRRRCVVEIECVLDTAFLVGSCRTAHGFKEALGRLTGFKTVEVKMRTLPMRRRLILDRLFPLYDALDERLAMTLREGKVGHREGYPRLVYHPRRG